MMIISASIFALIIIAIVAYKGARYIHKKFQHILMVERRTDIILGYLNLQNDINSATENEMLKIINKLSDEKEISQETKFDVKKRLCKLKIEYGTDKVEIANAYLCLAKTNMQAGDFINAIKNASYSVDLLTNRENSNYLAEIIAPPSSEEVTKILQKHNVDFYNWAAQDFKTEIAILSEFTNSEDRDLAARANYRLSLIYTFGKGNSGAQKNIDVAKAFEYQKSTINKLAIKPTKNTDVAFVFNEKYAPFAANTIVSILLNSDIDNHYSFYAIYEEKDQLSEDTKNKITSLSKLRDFDINFIPFPEKIIEDNKKFFDILLSNSTYPRIVILKALPEKILPNLDKILLMDVDILAFRDLHDLANINMEDYLIASVKSSQSFAEGRMYRDSECKNLPVQYFSNGVVLHNLKLKRQEDIFAKIHNQNSKCNYIFPEQDALNIGSSGKTMFFSSRWNTIPIKNEFEMLYPNNLAPFIIHYVGLSNWAEINAEKIKNGEEVPDFIRDYYSYYEFTKNYLK